MKKCLIVFFAFASLCATAQTGSEIYLFDVKIKKGKVLLSDPKNVTNHAGYDNQPSFHTDLPVLYYSSFDDAGRSDLKSYNYKTDQTKNVTVTPVREYSPTLTPDKNYLSCIIQRDNGAQDLGKYPIEGGEAITLIDNLQIGYHAWANNSHLVLFVLGNEADANTLHLFRLPTKRDTILAKNIGRSLHKIPKKNAISYVQKLSDKNAEIRSLNITTLESDLITLALLGKEDIAWTPNGILLTSNDTALFQLTKTGWVEIKFPIEFSSLKGITRLAINEKGDKLAVVVAE